MDVVRRSTVPDNVHQLHVQTTIHVWKTRGCQCSFRLLMMDGVSPETCRASYKYGIIKNFDMLLHFVGFFLRIEFLSFNSNVNMKINIKHINKFWILIIFIIFEFHTALFLTATYWVLSFTCICQCVCIPRVLTSDWHVCLIFPIYKTINSF